MKTRDTYSVAMYLRLSRDDENVGVHYKESNSIRGQRQMLKAFIERQPDMELYDIYVDDGWTGANFDRPGFIRMMKDIEEAKVNCVIVKDLSRLGRDYIEAGRLIQKTFPAFMVRFVAVDDHYDSLTADDLDTSLVVPIKNFINDSYCRDISQKVRSQKKLRMERGEYIGAFPIYGYQKDPLNHSHLVVDEYAAYNVKRIFYWKLMGYSNQGIAKQLEAMGILSPLAYKRINGCKCSMNFATSVWPKWSAVAVKRILSDEMYVGTMVQGRNEKISYKMKKNIAKPNHTWKRVEHTHEPIISKEMFSLASRLLPYECKPAKGMECGHMFTGLLFCGDCKLPLVRRIIHNKGENKVCYICSTNNKGKGCFPHSIVEEDLKQVLFYFLNLYILPCANNACFVEPLERNKANEHAQELMRREIEKLYKEREKYEIIPECLLDDLDKGILSKEEYRSFERQLQEQRTTLHEIIKRQERAVTGWERHMSFFNDNLTLLRNAHKIDKIDREVLLTFVENIHIHEDKRIRIKWRVAKP